MSARRFIEIDGKHYLWRDLLQLRHEQKKAHARAQQPVLFELKDDSRPVADRTATLTCDDGDGNVVYRQEIEYEDFPLDGIKLYFTDNTILLPSEY